MNKYIVYQNSAYRIEHSTAFVLPGYLFVVPQTDVMSLSELSVEALALLGPTLALAMKAVEDVVNPLNVYCAKFGESMTPLHFHIFPRTSWLTEAYHQHFPQLKRISGPILLDWVNTDFVRPHPKVIPPGNIDHTVSQFTSFFEMLETRKGCQHDEKT
jgi:diadenosine tetraphosphate (Ap4A) HIT family hydrolase